MITKNYIYLTLLCFLLSNASVIRSAEISTDLYVSGTILPAPQWQDQNANVITLISFSFDAAVAGAASQDVDSASFNFILRDTNNSGGSMNIGLLTPAGCKLGATDIDDGDVYFLLNSSAYANGSILNINEGTTYSAQIRFSGSGNYGNAAGLVTCSTTGTLTYTY